MSARPLHANAFDHLRLFAAWSVLVSHHFALSGRPEPGALGTSLGGLGVGIFFSLSGFLVSQSLLHDPHAGRFLAKRALRIVPGLAVNLVFCAFVVGALWTTLPLVQYVGHPDTWRYLADNLVFAPRFALPGVFERAVHPYAVNGSLWTLPFEVLAYVALAAFAIVARQHLGWVAPLLLVASLVAAVVWTPSEAVVVWHNDLRHVPKFMAYFFAGATLAFHGRRWLRAEAMVPLLAAYLLLEATAARAPLALLVVPLLAIHLGMRRPSPRWAIANDCSYGVYLYAYPIQQSVINGLPGVGFWPSMALAALLTYLCARLSWTFVERPALRLKPRRAVA